MKLEFIKYLKEACKGNSKNSFFTITVCPNKHEIAFCCTCVSKKHEIIIFIVFVCLNKHDFFSLTVCHNKHGIVSFLLPVSQ